jgi:hypothetical protein
MAIRYAWSRPKLHGELDAQVAGEHLESLVEKYNEHLTSEEILADARRAQSPLHEAFEWDDSTAAEKQRRSTARGIIGSLVVKTKNSDPKKRRQTRAFVFVKVPKHGRKCYMPVRSAMAQPELKAQVIEQAYKRLEQWIGLYGGSRALSSLTKDVERLRRKIEVEYLTAAGIV